MIPLPTLALQIYFNLEEGTFLCNYPKLVERSLELSQLLECLLPRPDVVPEVHSTGQERFRCESWDGFGSSRRTFVSEATRASVGPDELFRHLRAAAESSASLGTSAHFQGTGG